MLEVGGERSPLVESGPQQASEAVVFVHGNPGSHEDWLDLAARTGEFVRAVAFDMPGFGQADKPRGFDYRPEGYAVFLAAAFGELGIERVHLVLHDFGGPFGSGWAGSHPDRLARAVVMNSGSLKNGNPPGDFSFETIATTYDAMISSGVTGRCGDIEGV